MMAATEEQSAAWEAYKVARLKADQTLDINDGIASVRAYKEFYNLFAEIGRELPLNPIPKKTATFPIHKTRPPGGQPAR